MSHMLEPINLHQDKSLRPDGLTHINWSRGRCLIWDVTVTSSVASSNVARSSRECGVAAKHAETLKLRKYRELESQFIVQPIAFECHGCPGPLTEKFLDEMTCRLFEVTEDSRAGSFFEQNISIALQRGNAKAILSTMGQLEEDD